MNPFDALDGIFQGGIDERFTDWDSARQFVIFDTIVNNPRFDADTKVRLQQIEQDAYDATNGQITVLESDEIAQYYNYLSNQFPSVTDDERFLAIYDAAVQVKADEASVSFSDTEIPENVSSAGKKVLIGVGLYGLFLLLVGA